MWLSLSQFSYFVWFLQTIALKGLSFSIDNTSSYTKCVSISNKKCEIQPTVINLHPNEYTRGLCYYPCVINLDRCVGSCDIHTDLSNNVFVPNETEDLNISIFNMITGINLSKTLAKHRSCEYKCEFGDRKYGSNQKWNNDKCWCECKNWK